MIAFVGGPLDGRVLQFRRAPRLLRAVYMDEPGGPACVDVLDELDDTPQEFEAIAVYVRCGDVRPGHFLYRGRDRARTGWYPTGSYRWFGEVADADVRTTGAWRTWARVHDPAAERETARAA